MGGGVAVGSATKGSSRLTRSSKHSLLTEFSDSARGVVKHSRVDLVHSLNVVGWSACAGRKRTAMEITRRSAFIAGAC